MAAADDLDQVIEQYHLALDEIMRGSPDGYKRVYSRRDDVTLANPFGPPVRGWGEVAKTLERAASHYRDGEATGFENVAKYVPAELATQWRWSDARPRLRERMMSRRLPCGLRRSFVPKRAS